jgi:hypothetical protein
VSFLSCADRTGDAAPIPLIALAAMPYILLFAVIFLAGLTIIGSQTGAVGTCVKLYPARMRTSGLAWAGGFGRIGSIVAPMLGCYLLSTGLPPKQIFSFSRLLRCIDRRDGNRHARIARSAGRRDPTRRRAVTTQLATAPASKYLRRHP